MCSSDLDAHDPKDLNASLYEEAIAYLESLGIEIVKTIEPVNYEYLQDLQWIDE